VLPEATLQLDRAPKRLACGVKDTERLVAAKLEDLTAGRRDGLAGKLGEPGGKLSGLFVAVSLGEGRVAADVRNQKRADYCLGFACGPLVDPLSLRRATSCIYRAGDACVAYELLSDMPRSASLPCFGPEGWQSGRMRRSRKPLSVVRRIEGSNPSPSAS